MTIPYGTFISTKDGLLKVPDYPIKITLSNGDEKIIDPENPMYNTIRSYDRTAVEVPFGAHIDDWRDFEDPGSFDPDEL